jgi:hypothetical protein
MLGKDAFQEADIFGITIPVVKHNYLVKTTDSIARIAAEWLTARLGQNVLVENRPGASGSIATEIVARAPADGYTMLLGTPTQLAIYPALAKGPYDATRDFAPMSIVGTFAVMYLLGFSINALSLFGLEQTAVGGQIADCEVRTGDHFVYTLLGHLEFLLKTFGSLPGRLLSRACGCGRLHPGTGPDASLLRRQRPVGSGRHRLLGQRPCFRPLRDGWTHHPDVPPLCSAPRRHSPCPHLRGRRRRIG